MQPFAREQFLAQSQGVFLLIGTMSGAGNPAEANNGQSYERENATTRMTLQIHFCHPLCG